METKSVRAKQMETNNSGGNDERKKEWLRRQKEAFRSQLRVMPSFVSLPPGLVHIRMSLVAGHAFNTAASDDKDLMRQDGRMDSEAGRHSAESSGKLHNT